MSDKFISTERLFPEETQELKELASHMTDMLFAQRCLEEMRISTDDFRKDAMWRIAILYYCKCFFKSKKRDRIRVDQYLEEVPGSKACPRYTHKYFMNMRNKHLAHDENGMSKSDVVVRITVEDGEVVVGPAGLQILTGRAFDDADNLSNLIRAALDWLGVTSHMLCLELGLKIKKVPLETLLEQDPPTYYAPTADEI